MMRHLTAGLFTLVLLVLAACKPAEPPAATSSPSSAETPKDSSVTASYDCDGGHRVDIVEERTARIHLSDGQQVTIHYVENSRPPSFMGRGLRFAIGDQAIMLIPSDGAGVSCRPAT
ncbi:hypothetical protein IP90_00600 [Luteimonas cucumeris]|uniref:Membrane-bound lysozyme inhibitor of c-type lysozyme MliC n=1 Tax=Luteimonas cucumeris TaxID=985012 RepID=A0A562LFE2_9GAMM|nr:hypothetical protein [Luteimonas cucumeris]TWI06334.1 hypothetical protein IP90_00600 [Luteimonas cucumeris]